MKSFLFKLSRCLARELWELPGHLFCPNCLGFGDVEFGCLLLNIRLVAETKVTSSSVRSGTAFLL